MNYDRRHIESLRRRHQVYVLPFFRLFIVLAALVFVLMALLR